MRISDWSSDVCSSDLEVVITPPRRDHLDLVPIAVGIEPVQARCRPQPENRTVAGEVQRRLTPAVEVEGVVAQPLDATTDRNEDPTPVTQVAQIGQAHSRGDGVLYPNDSMPQPSQLRQHRFVPHHPISFILRIHYATLNSPLEMVMGSAG